MDPIKLPDAFFSLHTELQQRQMWVWQEGGAGWTEVTGARGWGEERQRPWGGTGRKGSQSERQEEGGAHRSQGGGQKMGLARQAGTGTLGAGRGPTYPETVLIPRPQAHPARTESRGMEPDL